MGFISLVNEIQFMLISSCHILNRSIDYLIVVFLLRELALTQSSQSSYGYTKNSDWLGKATVMWGGTFLESEVNEVRSLWKVFVFSTFLIPYWMIYVQVRKVLMEQIQ